MNGFAKFVNLGLNAAIIAEQNKAEIHQVFDELNRDLAQHWDGKLQIVLEGAAGSTFMRPARQLERGSIAAYNPHGFSRKPVVLAEWRMSEMGYPFLIDTPHKEVYCENRQALIKELQTMLASPSVGKHIQEVLAQEVTPELEYENESH